MKRQTVALVLAGLFLLGCSGNQDEEQRAPRAVSYVTLKISQPAAGDRLRLLRVGPAFQSDSPMKLGRSRRAQFVRTG